MSNRPYVKVKINILSNPEIALDFLLSKFHGEVDADGCINLPRIDLSRPTGPLDEARRPVDFSEIISRIMQHNGDVPTKITIGGQSEGLTIYSGEKKCFVIRNAFVIGEEPLFGDHRECAWCAYHLVQGLTGEDVQVIVIIQTKHVTLEKDDSGKWSIESS